MMHTIAVLLMSLPIWSADQATASSQTVVTHDLARLTPGEAQFLVGKRARYRISLGSLPDNHVGFVLFDCQSNDHIDRTVWLDLEQELASEMIVEATLHVLHHPARVGGDGTRFEGFTEYRLVGVVHH
jgi:hypothetical protein